MGKIKKWYRSIPLWLAFFLIIAVFLLLAAFASQRTTGFFNFKSNRIEEKYMTADMDDRHSDDDVLIRWNVDYHYEDYTKEDLLLNRLYKFASKYASVFWYSVCVLSAGILLYFTKLKKPLALLNHASGKIAESELDFSLEYAGNDEMATLCAAFETMREALDQNTRKMLHMIDERKQLNDAYTHDLRTPIAVLKGYSDILMKYIPEGKLPPDEVLNTVKTMSTHIGRLEKFVDSMNTVQKLEDLSIQKEAVATEGFLGHLRESAEILCKSSGLSCSFDAPVPWKTLMLDSTAVIQVYENLLNNAIRYAKSKVVVHCSADKDSFSLAVQDDGKGFSDRDLLRAAHPYFSGQGDNREFHFGLGLHICKTLCEKHGGMLEIANAPEGGAIITALFSHDVKHL